MKNDCNLDNNNYFRNDIIAKQKNFGDGKLQKYVTWIILLFMPLSTYITPIEGITVGDVFLSTSFVIMLLNIFLRNLNLNKVISAPLLLFTIFIVMHSLVFWTIKPDEFSREIFGVLRYLLYLATVVIGAKYFFNYEYAYIMYKRLAVIFSLYCIIQFFAFKYFSISLPPNLFGLPSKEYITAITSEYNINMYLSGVVNYRPRSVFLEPSYFAAYQIPILYFVLNNKNEKFLVKHGIGLLITLSMLLSGTSTGILLLLFCWWKPIIKEVKKLSLKFVFLIIIFIPGFIYILNLEYIHRILGRIISVDRTLGSSVVNRFQNYHIFFDGTLSWHDLIFGQGMWTSIGYLPSYGAIVLSFGIMGFLIFLILMLWTYFKTGKRGRAIVTLMFIMFIGTNTLFNISSVLIFFMIFSDYKNV